MIKGRSDGPGRPLLYGTTKEFLKYFGLNSIDDLPRVEELEAILSERENDGMHAPQLNLTGVDSSESTGALVLKRAMEQGVVRRFTIDNVVYSEESLEVLDESDDKGFENDEIASSVMQSE
jgi:hypothetical protein